MLMWLFCNTVISYDLENCFPSTIFKIISDPVFHAGTTETGPLFQLEQKHVWTSKWRNRFPVSLIPQKKFRNSHLSAFFFNFLHFENYKSLLQPKNQNQNQKNPNNSVLVQPQNSNMRKADTTVFQHQ